MQSFAQKVPGIFNLIKEPKLTKIVSSPEIRQKAFKMLKNLVMVNNENSNANIENIDVDSIGHLEKNKVNEENKIDDNVNDKDVYIDKLKELRDLWFIDEKKNIKLLKKYNGDVKSTIEKLFDLIG